MEAGIEMENTRKMSTEELKIQGLMEAFLLSRDSLKSSAAETSVHVDEDFLTAFTQGNLSERESTPVVSHLVNCGFCRHKTAELIRLDLAFHSEADSVQLEAAAEPHKISEVLSGLFAKIFGTADGAVFAHNETDADDKPVRDTEAVKENDSAKKEEE